MDQDRDNEEDKRDNRQAGPRARSGQLSLKVAAFVEWNIEPKWVWAHPDLNLFGFNTYSNRAILHMLHIPFIRLSFFWPELPYRAKRPSTAKAKDIAIKVALSIPKSLIKIRKLPSSKRL